MNEVFKLIRTLFGQIAKWLIILLIQVVQRLISWTRLHPRLACTTYLVIVVHIATFSILSYRSPKTTVLQKRNTVVVQTITLKPKPITRPQQKQQQQQQQKTKPVAVAVTKEKKKQVKPSKEKPKPELKRKPEPKKKAVAKKKAPKKETPKKKKANTNTAEKENTRQKELLNKALESLKKVDTKPIAMIPVLQLDTTGATTDEAIDPRDLGYCEELIQRLQLLLRLPEYGDVRVKLTLYRDGTIADLTVLNTKSTVNKSYVESTLPGKRFPPFGSHFSGERQHSFVLSLANE